jgi:hypothetical protein
MQSGVKKFLAVTSSNPKAFHLISCIVFLILAVITLRAFLVGDTLYIYRDDVWPKNLGHLISDSLNTFNLEATRRLIYFGPFFALSYLLGHSSLLAEKSLFMFTRFIIGFLPYLVTYKFLSSKLGDTHKNRIFAVSLIAGFFYAYNPFVTEKLGAAVVGFPISYAMIPLIFYYFDKALNEKGFYNILITSITVSVAVAGTQQYLVWLPIFLLVPWFGLVVAQRIRSHKPVFNTVKNSLLVFLFFILISFYWILMAVSIIVTTGAPKPVYVLTEQMLDEFSSSTSLLNVIRLMGIWWPYVELTPIVDQSLWIFLTFVIPVGVILSVLLLRNKQLKFYSVSFFLIVLFIMFFYKGTQQPEGWLYLFLYYVPVVGWMFRVPESNGMFIPFFVMMILSFGFYGLLKASKNRRIAYIKTIPVLILISSLVLLCWPMFTGDFGGIYSNQQPSTDIISNDMNDDKHLIAPKENIAIVGGSDIADSIYDSRLIDPTLSSVFFNDENDMDALSRSDSAIRNIVSDDGSGLLIHFLNKNSSIIKISDATLQHDPAMVWSKARTDDPTHAPFHNYLDQFRMTNRDFDYGKGLVLTWGQDRLDIPFEAKATDAYNLYLRYLQNPEGGKLKFYLDNNEIKEISTTDLLAKFVWQNIGTFNLTKGTHKLTLENIYGFNAANIFALIPTLSNLELANQPNGIMTNVTNNVSNIASNTTGAAMTEASKLVSAVSNASANATNGTATTMTQPQTVVRTSVNETANTTGKAMGEAKNILSTTANATANASGEEQMAKTNNVLTLATSPGSNATQTAMDQENSFVSNKRIIYVLNGNSSFYNINHQIDEDTIIPKTNGTFERTFFKQLKVPNNSTQLSLQFSSKQNPALASYYQIKGLEINPIGNKSSILTSDFETSGDLQKWEYRTSNLSSEANNPISGMKSLRVDIPKSNRTDWDMVKSSFIPVDENVNLNYKFSIVPVDVNGLHGKVYYYDEKKNMIGVDYLFNENELTPNGKYNSSYLTPEGTQYIKVQFWFHPNPEKATYFLLDDVNVEQTTDLPSYNNILDTASRVDMKSGNSSNSYIMETKPIPIKENSTYNLWIDVKGQNLDSFEAKAVYSTSDIKNDRHVVYVGTLQPHSETFRNITVLKTSNYTIAAQVRACSYCTFLRIKLGDSIKEFSIKNELTQNDLVRDKLFYFTTNLTAGNNDLRVYSDGKTNLYKVIVYPNNSGLALSPHSETFRNIKVLKTSNYTIAAQATTCGNCTFLRIKLGDSIKTFSLKNNQTQDKWFYFTTNLTAGNNDLRVYSDGNTNLYKVIIYSDSYKNETLSDLFDPKKASAAVLSFDKIDPSHYQARVNATKPFVLKFTGPYKPAWTAYVSGRQYGSVELYPFEAKANYPYNLYTDTNGFFIPETGELSIKIEYQSQKWFYVGSLVTISTILGSVCYLALERRDAIRRLSKIVVSGKPRLIWQYFSQQIGNKK